MLWSGVGLAAVLIVWSLTARRLRRWRITSAMVMVVGGALVGASTGDALASTIDTDVISPLIGTVLAIVLFEHATNIRRGVFGGESRLTMRLLFIAMPVGLLLAVGAGLWLLPGLGWATLLVMACVLVPIDFAPVISFLHDERIPLRLRQLFSVEEGYSDGVISPVFVFALAVATGTHTKGQSVVEAIASGVPHLGIAISVGVAVGAGVAKLANIADRHDLMTEQTRRIVMVCAPVLTFTVNLGFHGNGFVAAFVCGIVYNGVRTYVDAADEQELIDDVTFPLSALVWFVFGATAWYLLKDGVPWRVICFSIVLLIIGRAIPVALSMVRSRVTRAERVLLIVLGPRGTANIILALLAFNVLPDEPADRLLEATILVVLGSVVLHGLLGEVLVARYAEDVEAAGTH